MVFVLFLIWRIVDVFVAFVAPRLIPYLGFFAYQKDLASYHLPKIISSLANFDGLYYLRIAQRGYQQYEQVFFPFYPFLVRIFSPVFINNYLMSGLFISNLSFLLGLIIFYKYLLLTMKPFSHLAIIFFLLFPTSFFFGVAYTEGLFFLLIILSLYFLKKNRLFFAGFCGFLAALTRVQGVLLIIPFCLEAVRILKNKRKFWSISLVSITPVLGLLTYMRYLLKTTGDQFYFFHSQTVFGPSRSTKIILLPQVFYRYLKIFLTSQHNFQYFISAFEFITFSFALIILILDFIENFKLKIKNFSLIGLNLFSLANILLPTFTGSFMSIPRFALLSLSFFVFLGRIKNRLITLSLLVLFLIFHIVLLGFFIQGYFVS
ncbi:hypothetical protein COS31_04225 [Candidatus Roizmanbacteria bacterium CG02_land_8_20_14_3_00_36_15]|uniref:Glycosyltransferase RgtA/B/C/D-like domain-containing protein n=2 Tax=Candidatus Roizmaniibacteriota TaxID=1752723 RepID=A0A2M8KL71_9BACT|nr:MAG: hypothetical protein COS31_04225 [Candidatus Roizmanbacteria bacterium CG02_land_8_20_14_3_00_36_15]PIY69842.1 MAG: hypothetical protein COY89_04340 [Candidatus Roizmanbacteria bacterium CG_4_10_14_0_8_um_filter_36_36]PJA53215.1 MAG: hypothetical protein CO166_02605 [Candidatus Roizmanbacteria bacterium CG_4_9_14_3_um_filter_36_11]PJC81565.1 MAG: hypothetical protein CO007_03995 [Candidatus Roizmanbacteria bacterium CG_4_8_14_3_um_filter_36_10]PJE60662.1 MAG: hypothetical protein COU86_